MQKRCVSSCLSRKDHTNFTKRALKMGSRQGDMYLGRDIFATGCIPGVNDYDEHTCTCMIYGC